MIYFRRCNISWAIDFCELFYLNCKLQKNPYTFCLYLSWQFTIDFSTILTTFKYEHFVYACEIPTRHKNIECRKYIVVIALWQ